LLRGLPMAANSVAIVVDNAAGSQLEAVVLAAGPGFFETLRIPLLYGSGFDTRDRADTPRVAVITDRMARQYFGTVNAVGRRFRVATDTDVWTEAIGVVRDTGTGSFDDDVLDPIAPPFYTSYTQTAALPTTVIARTHLSRVRQSAPLRTGNGAAAATRRSSATTDGFPSPACGKSSLRHAG
jgi:hypothetical protein